MHGAEVRFELPGILFGLTRNPPTCKLVVLVCVAAHFCSADRTHVVVNIALGLSHRKSAEIDRAF